MKPFYFILLILLINLNLSAQKLTQSRVEQFINSLITNDANLINFIDPQTLDLSRRLGVEYEGVANKFLLSYDIDAKIKKGIEEGSIKFEITIEDTTDGFSILDFSVPAKNYLRRFIFKNGLFVSPILYFTRHWQIIESGHFIFLISDSTQFNKYCVDNLEKFYADISNKLKFSPDEELKIASKKIFYVLCKDEDEIKKLTSYYAKGMYNLAYDCIITTYNAHYHELLHLLINYKLKKLPLYTHPFFQEGFAVAFGGRGGYEPDVILNPGVFLEKSGFMKYSELLTTDSFNKNDASMTYPISGLFNKFFINIIGVENYIGLYRKYSGDYEKTKILTIDTADFPDEREWNKFIDSYSKNGLVRLGITENDKQLLYSSSSGNIYSDGVNYYFEIKDTLLIPGDNDGKTFISKKYGEMFVNKKYNGEKYLITANESEISIYNLYTNNLIANYVKSFEAPQQPVPQKDECFLFTVKKDLFDGNLIVN